MKHLKREIKYCVRHLKMLNALPPYDEVSNFYAGDGRFAKWIEETYTADVKAKASEIIAAIESQQEIAE